MARSLRLATLLTFVQAHRQALFPEEGLHVVAELLQGPLRKLNLHPRAQRTLGCFLWYQHQAQGPP